MAFCTNCGHQLADGAKFCFECGAKVNIPVTPKVEQRKTVYDGEIHKCPNCGEVLNAFESICKTCGYEKRGTTAIRSIREFAQALNQPLSEHQRASVIQNFPVPNNKEDIFEFLILALSNTTGEKSKAVRDAWRAKAEQCYQKAKLSFYDDSDFGKIQTIYNDIGRKLAKENTQKVFSIFEEIFSLLKLAISYPIVTLAVIVVCYMNINAMVERYFAPVHLFFSVWILGVALAINLVIKKRKK